MIASMKSTGLNAASFLEMLGRAIFGGCAGATAFGRAGLHSQGESFIVSEKNSSAAVIVHVSIPHPPSLLQRRPGQLSRSEHICKQIIAAILRGELGENRRLPTEVELAQRYEASRTTVREALSRLRSEASWYRAAAPATMCSACRPCKTAPGADRQHP
jgi:hypothetical protein